MLTLFEEMRKEREIRENIEEKITSIPRDTLLNEYVNIKNYIYYLNNMRMKFNMKIIIVFILLVLGTGVLSILHNSDFFKKPEWGTNPTNAEIVDSIHTYTIYNNYALKIKLDEVEDYVNTYNMLEKYVFSKNEKDYPREYKIYKNRITVYNMIYKIRLIYIVSMVNIILYILTCGFKKTDQILVDIYMDKTSRLKVFKKELE